MDELTDLMAALHAQLTTAMPTRVVSRDFVDFSQRKEADLLAGVVTVIAQGEREYSDVIGRAAQGGTLGVILVGQVKVAENAAPSAVEDAEFALVGELKAFCLAVAPPLGALVLRSFRQSGQLEHPYGWIAAEMEMLS